MISHTTVLQHIKLWIKVVYKVLSTKHFYAVIKNQLMKIMKIKLIAIAKWRRRKINHLAPKSNFIQFDLLSLDTSKHIEIIFLFSLNFSKIFIENYHQFAIFSDMSQQKPNFALVRELQINIKCQLNCCFPKGRMWKETSFFFSSFN